MTTDEKPKHFPDKAEIKSAFDQKLKDEEMKQAIYIQTMFDKLVSQRRLQVEKEPDGSMIYIIARSTKDKAEAVTLAERLDTLHLFDKIKSVCFLNGMIDGVEKYRGQLVGLKGTVKMLEAKGLAMRAVKIGDELLAMLKRGQAEATGANRSEEEKDRPMNEVPIIENDLVPKKEPLKVVEAEKNESV